MAHEQMHQATPDMLPELVEKDIGSRKPLGWTGKLIVATAILWSLFQLWIASPFQYEVNFIVVNNTEARAIHLAFATFLAFLVCPAFARSPRRYIPLPDWAMALVGVYCAAYLFIEYEALAYRPGMPTQWDIIVSAVGIMLLLEAARRSLGPPMAIIAVVFLLYTFVGSWEYMPDIIRHKGQSFEKVANHQWLSSEGVFGIALGVSTGFVFLFVLFGALLEKVGAGNYFIQLAFALLGHLRGGPAKAAVLSSALTGVVSGSSIANVVMTGTFTIPLMRRIGFSREKAGAVEVSSSVNGQIMPPVMGAAAFLMVEYVGISYTEVIRHAFIPAIISYIALLYIVHLEALKMDMPVIPRRKKHSRLMGLAVFGLTVSSLLILCGVVYYGLGWIKQFVPDYSLYIIFALLAAAYIGLLWYEAQFPPLEQDDPDAKRFELPDLAVTVKTGLHYILALAALIWCLMVERLSPGLSAFIACGILIVMLITQRPLTALFRKEGTPLFRHITTGFKELADGLETGARNMVGISVATAAAGIIVGTVSLTGVGQVMTEVVEMLSGGSFLLVLIYTAVISLLLGMGLPTTANYIVVASIMAAVIQELGAKHGFYIPTIAIHLFVFYFGIMADVTPPVGLASFAAAAVSGGDPIRTGVQSFLYSSRTIILPFFFIFNHKLLLIGVDGWMDGIAIFLLFTAAILLFTAAVQGYFITRSKWYESVALLLISSMLFIPGRWMALAFPPFAEVPPIGLEAAVSRLEPGKRLHLRVETLNTFGDPEELYMHILLDGATTQERMEQLGVTLLHEEGYAVVENTAFGKAAEKAGLQFDDKILAVRLPLPQPSRLWCYGLAAVFCGIIIALQFHRRKHLARKKADALLAS